MSEDRRSFLSKLTGVTAGATVLGGAATVQAAMPEEIKESADPEIIGMDRLKWKMVSNIRGITEEPIQDLDYSIRYLTNNKCHIEVERSDKYPFKKDEYDSYDLPLHIVWVVSNSGNKCEILHHWKENGSVKTNFPEGTSDTLLSCTGEMHEGVIPWLFEQNPEEVKKLQEFIGV